MSDLPELPTPRAYVTLAAAKYTADDMRSFAREAMEIGRRAERERIEAAIVPLLDGIDKDQCESDEGWWETSTGAEFGAKTLASVIAAIRAVSNPADSGKSN